MPYLDNHVLMTLKLDRWAQDHHLRAFEIEREVMAARQPCTPPARRKRLSLGNLKLLWTRTA